MDERKENCFKLIWSFKQLYTLEYIRTFVLNMCDASCNLLFRIPKSITIVTILNS